MIHAITESDLQVNGYLLGDLLENGTKELLQDHLNKKQ